MPIRKPIPDFAGRRPIKKEPPEIKKYKDLDLEHLFGDISKAKAKIHSKRINKAIKDKLLKTLSLNFAKYELGNNIDYVKRNPKALRLRFNKQLNIFAEKYIPYFKFDIISKEPHFRELFSRLTIEEKISYLDFVLSSDFLQKMAKERTDECYFTMINILERRVAEISLSKRIKELHQKYKDDPDKIITEVKNLIKGKYLESYDKYRRQLMALEPIFKSLDKSSVLHILETIYVNGIDHPITNAIINSYMEHAGIKGLDNGSIKGTFNN